MRDLTKHHGALETSLNKKFVHIGFNGRKLFLGSKQSFFVLAQNDFAVEI
jgi:hypothetical protein